MKVNFKISKFLVTPLCGVVLLLVLFQVPSVNGQEFIEKNTIYLIGQVTNQLNGGPIKEQEITILSDTTYQAGFNYQNIVFTDIEGYFYDTITTAYNKGGLVVSTTDYLGNNQDTTVYCRFNWSEVNVLLVNFYLPTEPPQVYYHANFYYQRNPSGQNPSEYQFYDLTNSGNILSHLWEFGDGFYSSESNPIHQFLQSGIYRVMLTVTIQPDPYSQPIVSSIVKVINVTVKDYFYIGGHVMAAYFPIDHGEAYLYKIESNALVPIDTAVFNDTLGYYLFYQVIEGEYLVKADLCPNSIHFNHFLSTYYSNKPQWTQADTIFHTANNHEYDIELIPVTQSFSGQGSISGNIFYGFDSKDGGNLPACNVEILLLNENLEPSICTHSIENGEFEFQNLDPGHYYIHPEVTGKYTYPLMVSLDDLNSAITGVTLTIGSFAVYGNISSVTENEMTYLIGQPYPNPASESACIELQTNDVPVNSISLLSITGQMIREYNPSSSMGSDYIFLDTKCLNPGIYFVRIEIQNQIVLRKLIKK